MTTPREDAGKPPTPWTTIDKVSREWGLYDVVSRALLGKFSPSRRQLLVGNIVMAVAKWRENFRDCGCWKTDDGYALCPWHERMLQSQVAPLRAALAAAPETPREDAIAYPGNPHDSPIWQELADALDKAMIRHAPMHSPHEGHSVIREELDELWEHVRGDTGRSTEARKEAIQIAAMGLRYALDLCDE